MTKRPKCHWCDHALGKNGRCKNHNCSYYGYAPSEIPGQSSGGESVKVDSILKGLQTVLFAAFAALLATAIVSAGFYPSLVSRIPAWLTLGIILSSLSVYVVRSLKGHKGSKVLWWLVPLALAVLFVGSAAQSVQAQSTECRIVYYMTVQCVTVPLPDWLGIFVHVPTPVCWFSWVPIQVGPCATTEY
jgi:hypothetical protein